MRLRTKLGVGALGMVLAAAAVFVVWAAIISQEERSTGSVHLNGDLIEVSPATDWLTLDSYGEAATSTVGELTFTNVSGEDAMLVELDRIEMTPSPNPFEAGALVLNVGFKVAGACPDPLVPVPIVPGALTFNKPIGPSESAVLCGELEYDGSLGEINEDVDLDFYFLSETTIP